VEHHQVNDIRFTSSHVTIVGSHGRFSYWDMKMREDQRGDAAADQHLLLQLNRRLVRARLPLVEGAFCVIAVNDAAQVHEYTERTKKPRIDLHACMNEMK